MGVPVDTRIKDICSEISEDSVEFPKPLLDQVLCFKKAAMAMEQADNGIKEELNTIITEFNERINTALKLQEKTDEEQLSYNLIDSIEYLEWILAVSKEGGKSLKARILIFLGAFYENRKIFMFDIASHFSNETYDALGTLKATLRQLINKTQPDNTFQVYKRERNAYSVKRRSPEIPLTIINKPSVLQNKMIMNTASKYGKLVVTKPRELDVLKTIFAETNKRLAQLLIDVTDKKSTATAAQPEKMPVKDTDKKQEQPIKPFEKTSVEAQPAMIKAEIALNWVEETFENKRKRSIFSYLAKHYGCTMYNKNIADAVKIPPSSVDAIILSEIIYGVFHDSSCPYAIIKNSRPLTYVFLLFEETEKLRQPGKELKYISTPPVPSAPQQPEKKGIKRVGVPTLQPIQKERLGPQKPPTETDEEKSAAPRKKIIIKTEPGALNEIHEWKKFTTLISSLQIYEDIMMFFGTKRASQNITTKKALMDFLIYRMNYDKRYSKEALENHVNEFFKDICGRYAKGKFKIIMDNNGNISVEITQGIAVIDMFDQKKQAASAPHKKPTNVITQKQSLKTRPEYEEWVKSVTDNYKNAGGKRILMYIGNYPPQTFIPTKTIREHLRKEMSASPIPGISQSISGVALDLFIFSFLNMLSKKMMAFTVKEEKYLETAYMIYKTGEKQAITTKFHVEQEPRLEPQQKIISPYDQKMEKLVEKIGKIESSNNDDDDSKPLDFDQD